MYKILVVNANNLGTLEDELNAMKEDGFRPIHFWNLDSRLICVLEYVQRGRPAKSKDELSLGE